ncbi:MAG: MGMT family protein [Pseudobacteriovorax sp.]|nr:MGMT family protein [Pseudobacteriovorax sp.]
MLGIYFATKYGYAALAVDSDELQRLWLPYSNLDRLRQELVDEGYYPFEWNKETPEFPSWVDHLVELIQRYFRGLLTHPDFSFVPLNKTSWSRFQNLVYKALHEVPYGMTMTYRELADKIGSPGAARAVGTCMAKNKFPLIMPCHRIIKSDGKIGNFTADGSVQLKQAMLSIESSGFATDDIGNI